MFRKVLIANRGEIAVRVIRACRELGVRSVAVHSEADARALHVREADEAHLCGPAPARESYLDGERIAEIAAGCGAEAVHPGYGFLAESPEFAEQCARRGIAFIGPSPQVIRLMGDKVESRRAMREAGVPVVPGTSERVSDEEATRQALAMGLPVMVKASAGGGGRGLRMVSEERKLPQALKRARGEALAAFGDDGLYLEKVVERPRHIEVQLLADAEGRVVHLFERECSIQRRHQKLVEEAPANHLPPALREALGEAACTAARAVGYVGAGTCEFLVDPQDRFYFLEMNTRVQVEHPVTEEITGVDIVQAMIRVAAGEPLGLEQRELAIRGHAIEARVYAEDPDRRFLPSPGTLERFRAPSGPGIRLDSGVVEGDVVSVHYDALLAKLIAWGETRREAIERLEGALAAFDVEGIKTSIVFHRRLVRHPLFLEGRYDTGFIEAHMAPAK